METLKLWKVLTNGGDVTDYVAAPDAETAKVQTFNEDGYEQRAEPLTIEEAAHIQIRNDEPGPARIPLSALFEDACRSGRPLLLASTEF